MGRQVFQFDEYKVFKARGGYVIHNTRKSFKNGHTHVKDFTTTKYLIHLSKHKEIPVHLSKYLWISLERISTGKGYCRKLRCVIDELFLGGITK